MPAEIVIRGGTVFDGTGAPGRVADVAIADGVILEIGPDLARRPRARRLGLRGRARLHRHPHPLRRAGVLGSGAAAVVVPRGHDRRSRATAASPSRRPAPSTTTSIVRTLENVEDMDPATLAAGIAWDFETFPEYLDAVAAAGHGAQLHRVRRPLGAAALRDGRRRVRAGGDAGRDRAHVRAGAARRSRPARRDSRRASRTRTGASTASRSRAASPTATRSRRCSARPARRARASCSSRPASSAATPTSTSGSRKIGRPFTYPLFASAGRQAPRAGRAARAGPRRRRATSGRR